MKKKKKIGIWLLTLGVLLLLLRPYLVYQMTMTGTYRVNPERAWNLLQKLVKKKDDRHETESEIAVLNEIRFNLLEPSCKLLNVFASLLNSRLNPIGTPLNFPDEALLPVIQHRYLMIACFLI